VTISGDLPGEEMMFAAASHRCVAALQRPRGRPDGVRGYANGHCLVIPSSAWVHCRTTPTSLDEPTGERDAQCCCPWSGRGTWTLFDFRPSDPVFASADHRQFDSFGSQVRLWPRGYPRASRALSAPVHLPTRLAHGPPWLALHPQLVTASVEGAFAHPSRRPRPF
jgi:hypothetical protein